MDRSPTSLRSRSSSVRMDAAVAWSSSKVTTSSGRKPKRSTSRSRISRTSFRQPSSCRCRPSLGYVCTPTSRAKRGGDAASVDDSLSAPERHGVATNEQRPISHATATMAAEISRDRFLAMQTPSDRLGRIVSSRPTPYLRLARGPVALDFAPVDRLGTGPTATIRMAERAGKPPRQRPPFRPTGSPCDDWTRGLARSGRNPAPGGAGQPRRPSLKGLIRAHPVL